MTLTDDQIFYLCLMGILLLIGIFFFLSKKFPGVSYEGELNLAEIKHYFFKKHRCRGCGHGLKRKKEKEFLEEGWTWFRDVLSYMKQYKVSYSLQCPNCQRTYTAEDFEA